MSGVGGRYFDGIISKKGLKATPDFLNKYVNSMEPKSGLMKHESKQEWKSPLFNVHTTQTFLGERSDDSTSLPYQHDGTFTF